MSIILLKTSYSNLSIASVLAIIVSLAAFVVPVASVNLPSALYYTAVALVFLSLAAWFLNIESHALTGLEKIMIATWVAYPLFTAVDLWLYEYTGSSCYTVYTS